MEGCVFEEKHFFLWWKQCLWGLAVQCTHHIPVSQPLTVQHTRACLPPFHVPSPEGTIALPDLAWWPAEDTAVCPSWRTQDPIPGHGTQELPQQGRSVAATWVKAVTCGAAYTCILQIFSDCNDVKQINFIFSPLIQCQREPLCQMGSIEPKTNVKVKILSHQFYNLFNMPLVFTNTTKFLNLTTAPMCTSQNHMALTIPCAPLSSLSILSSYSSWPSGHLSFPPESHYYGDLRLTQSGQPMPWSWSSTDSFGVRFLTLWEGEGPVGQCL